MITSVGAPLRVHFICALAHTVGQKQKAKDLLEYALRSRLVGEDADQAKQVPVRN
jgi:hypothetical protein